MQKKGEGRAALSDRGAFSTCGSVPRPEFTMSRIAASEMAKSYVPSLAKPKNTTSQAAKGSKGQWGGTYKYNKSERSMGIAVKGNGTALTDTIGRVYSAH